MAVLRFPLLALLAAALLAGGCSGRGAASNAESGSSEVAPEAIDAEPAHGNVMVSWRNLDPRYPATAIALVNESSATGQKLKSGQVTSSNIRVLSDTEMGWLLEQMTKRGFYDHAKDGLDVTAASQVPGRKGIVNVEQDGATKGLLLTTGLGTSAVPKVYVEVKDLVNYVHAHVPGGEVKASVGAPDENIFSVPPPRLKRP